MNRPTGWVKPGSITEVLAALDVGQAHWLEVPLEELDRHRRQLSGTRGERRPGALQGRTFTTTAWTAVAANGIGQERYLIRVERTE